MDRSEWTEFHKIGSMKVRQRVDAGRKFQDAVPQVLAANAHGFNPSQQVRTS